MSSISEYPTFCLFCYKSVSSDVESADNLESIKHFVNQLFRFVGGGKCSDNAGIIEQDINKFTLNSELLNCCEECKITIAEFSQVYHQIKCLELQLDLKLDKLLGVIELSSKIPKRWTNIRNTLEQTMEGNIKKVERNQSLIKGIRQQIIKSGVKRSAISYPRVLVEINSGDLNFHKQVVIKTEPILDEITDEVNGTDTEDPAIKVEPEELQSEVYENNTRNSIAELTLSSKLAYEKCKICQRKCSAHGLELHFKRCHDLTKVSNNHTILRCKEDGCTAYFLTKRQLRLHRLQHIKRKKLGGVLSTEFIDGKKYFKCNVCKTPFDKIQRLKRHLTTTTCGNEGNTNGVSLECTECKETFETKENLWMHQSQVHSTDKKKVCTKCGKWFDRKWNFMMHLEFHKGPAEWKWKCDKDNCGKKFASEQMLRRHAKTHTTNEQSLQNDLVVEQPIVGGNAEIVVNRKTKEDNQTNIKKTAEEDHLNGCKLCGIVLPNKKDLLKHLANHKDPNVWIRQCKECGKRCISEYKLQEHMRIHTGEKPFKCHLCSDTFSHAHSMKRHLKGRHGVLDDQQGSSSRKQAKISCEICGKIFGYRANLMRHWRHHYKNGEIEQNTSDPGMNADESNLPVADTSDDLRDPLEILPSDISSGTDGNMLETYSSTLLDEIY